MTAPVVSRLSALVFVAAWSLGGCVTDADTGAPAPGPSPSERDALAGFPVCDAPPTPDAAPPDGASLPVGAVVEAVERQGPLTNVTGYVPVTPVTIRGAYEASEDLDVLVIEDEIVEVEVLVTDGAHRTFFKGNAVCATGTRFIAVVAPELEGSLVPRPAGSPSS